MRTANTRILDSRTLTPAQVLVGSYGYAGFNDTTGKRLITGFPEA